MRSIALLTALAVSLIGTGWLIAHGHVIYVGAAGAVAALVVLAMRAPGPLAALLLLAVLNGVPVVNLGGRLPGGLKFDDAAVFALGALLLAYQARARNPQHARIVRTATLWSACFIAWWCFTFARSVLLDGIPPLKAALFGRDFLYFAILLPLALGARFPGRSLRAGAFVLATGIALFAVGDVIASLSGRSLSGLVHPAILDTSTSTSVTRVYSSMSYLADTALILTSAWFLSKDAHRRRILSGGAVALLLAAAMLELTRANYFGLAAAFFAGLLVYMVCFASVNRLLVRGTVVILLAIAGTLAVITFDSSSTVRQAPVVSPFVARVTSGISDLSQGSGNVGYRENLDAEMLKVLGGRWPGGLGFLHPDARYISALPSGTIRNADTGFFNGLMTMGVIGLALIYAPLLYGIRVLLRGRLRRTPPWIVYGGVAWVAWVVTGSVTLILLFSVPGVMVTALALGALAHVSSDCPTWTLTACESPVTAGVARRD